MIGAESSTDPSGQAAPQKVPAYGEELPAIDLDPVFLKASLMHPQGLFGRVEVVASAGSTNTDLAASAADPQQFWPDLSVLIANAQPAGKGRLGRTWDAPAGAAMISSILVFPGEGDKAPGQLRLAQPGGQRNLPGRPVPAGNIEFSSTGYGWLSIMAGVALCQTLRALGQVPAELKWPNDVVVDGRKVAGILAQVVPARTPRQAEGVGNQAGIGVVIGAGLNVSLRRDQLPTERATSLLLESSATLDRNQLLGAYLNKFAVLYGEFVAVGGDAQRCMPGGNSLLEIARSYMGTLGKEVRAELPGGNMVHGTASGLASDGGLEIRENSGKIHHISAGDVIHLRRTAADGTVNYA